MDSYGDCLHNKDFPDPKLNGFYAFDDKAGWREEGRGRPIRCRVYIEPTYPSLVDAYMCFRNSTILLRSTSLCSHSRMLYVMDT